MSRAQTRVHFDSIVEFSGIEQFIDTQVKFYSSGMYIRLAFSVAVHVDPDVLLVDEVLAVGDEPFQRKCMDRIRSFQAEGRTIVLVTHALDQVAELCDRAIVLEHGNMHVDGDPLDALRFLRADFEITRQEDRVRERQSELRAVTSTAQVESVTLRDGAGQPLTVLRPGEPMSVHIAVRATSRLDDWILGFGIETSLGTSVYGTNTRLLDIVMPAFSGERTFQIRLPQVWLGEGSYTVHGAIAEQSGVEIDRMKEAASFTVQSDGHGLGTLYVAPELVITE